jgi:hypothetical protein
MESVRRTCIPTARIQLRIQYRMGWRGQRETSTNATVQVLGRFMGFHGRSGMSQNRSVAEGMRFELTIEVDPL